MSRLRDMDPHICAMRPELLLVVTCALLEGWMVKAKENRFTRALSKSDHQNPGGRDQNSMHSSLVAGPSPLDRLFLNNADSVTATDIVTDGKENDRKKRSKCRRCGGGGGYQSYRVIPYQSYRVIPYQTYNAVPQYPRSQGYCNVCGYGGGGGGGGSFSQSSSQSSSYSWGGK